MVNSEKHRQRLMQKINQLVSKSVVSDEVIDIYDSLGLEKPDISILSDQFLEDVKALPQKNVAIQLLERLLKGEVKYLMRTNATKSKKFSEMAKDIERAQKEGEELGLNADEIAFYDALANHETTKEVMGDETLRAIAHELTMKIKENMSVDWHKRDSAQAKMRVTVRRLLKEYD